jgi:hypothetical protein
MTGDEILRFFRVLRGFGFAASSKRFWNIMIRYIYPPLGLDVNTKGASHLVIRLIAELSLPLLQHFLIPLLVASCGFGRISNSQC